MLYFYRKSKTKYERGPKLGAKTKKRGLEFTVPGKYCMLLERCRYNNRWILIQISSSSIFKIVTISGNPIPDFVRLNIEDAGVNEINFRQKLRGRLVGVQYEKGDTRESFFARCLLNI